jgi:pyruvate dehydrogenase E2 component (dihydrolipoamide acetyltransferase)
LATATEIHVPDIGDFKDVDVIEVLVTAGDRVSAEDPLITLESDKATMDVPSPHAGVIKDLKIKVGDKVSQGSPILTIELAQDGEPTPSATASASGAHSVSASPRGDATERTATAQVASTATPAKKEDEAQAAEVRVPDIGDFKDVDVIAVLVSPGDRVNVEDPLITLESDKATMDVPSPYTGVVSEVKTKVGDKVSAGSAVLTLQRSAESMPPTPEGLQEPDRRPSPAPAAGPPPTQPEVEPQPRPSPTEAVAARIDETAFRKAHASPTIRRFARELGVDLGRVTGTGPKSRILKEDVQAYVKGVMQRSAVAPSAGFVLPEMPEIDFSKFGEIKTQPLSRIKKISGPTLHRSWLHVPHVTQHEEADITDLENFRQELKEESSRRGVRLTLLAFLLKATVAALKEHPHVNASLDPSGESLILKRYYHIGVAVDTPEGLVVPVIRDVDKKSVFDLAAALADVSAKARDKKLAPADIQGASFTISSLGGIGGTSFTPIVNAPEVAILGVSRARMQPVYRDDSFVPRLMLPLSFSYDHRVIDGAQAARFTSYLAQVLADVRRLLL